MGPFMRAREIAQPQLRPTVGRMDIELQIGAELQELHHKNYAYSQKNCYLALSSPPQKKEGKRY